VLLRRPLRPHGSRRRGRRRGHVLQLQPGPRRRVHPPGVGAGQPGCRGGGPLRCRRCGPDPAARRRRHRLPGPGHDRGAGARGRRRLQPRGPCPLCRTRRPRLANQTASGAVARPVAAARAPRRRPHRGLGGSGAQRARGPDHPRRDGKGLRPGVRPDQPRLEHRAVGCRHRGPHHPRPDGRGGRPDAGWEALRERVEAETDAMAAAPWQHLGEEHTADVIRIGAAMSATARAAGAVPKEGVFAAR